jgi:C terminal of Calcineurin-like phosphoesterase/N terminal of Calcineurin-like phosphoesterase/Calcineurin-like phosphoesterase
MNRRIFLERAGLLATGMVVSLKSNAFNQLTHGNTITGRVTDGKNAVANAVLSDGFFVVKTDVNGRYSINLSDKSEFLFLSTPSGYDFKTDVGSINRQYENLGARNEINFVLKKLRQNDDKHHFIIWADPQVKNKKDVAQMMETSVPDVKYLVRSLGTNALVHGIGVGDLVWDNLPLFDDYNKAVEQMGIPFFQCLGNHDMDYRQGGDETSDRTFKKYYGPTYYSFNRGKAHYIILDDVRYLGEERKYDGYITEEQLAWMEKDLQFVGKDQLIIVNVHIPIHNSVKNNEAFYKILNGFTNVHVMSGHTHYNKNVIKQGVFEHNHGAVCGAWWTGPICSDGTPRGYGVYEVEGTKLKWYYKGTGLERTKQISIDIEPLTGNYRIIANIWNYDPEWKIECFLDGQSIGKMEMMKGFDPEAVRLYKGEELPVGRPFAEPSRTEHLFMAHCSTSVKKVKIMATDRFGEQFVEEKKLS